MQGQHTITKPSTYDKVAATIGALLTVAGVILGMLGKQHVATELAKLDPVAISAALVGGFGAVITTAASLRVAWTKKKIANPLSP